VSRARGISRIGMVSRVSRVGRVKRVSRVSRVGRVRRVSRDSGRRTPSLRSLDSPAPAYHVHACNFHVE
jgi:hypothetical protein